MPQENMHNRSAKTEIVAHLRDGVRSGVPRKSKFRKLLSINRIVRCENGTLVVSIPVPAKQGGWHEFEISTVESIAVVGQGKDKISDSHTDWKPG